MTRLRRKLGLFVALVPLATTAFADGLQDSFSESVKLLRRGQADEALQALQELLASDPSQEDVYELWTSTEHELWLDLLTEGGEFELIAQRLMGLAREGRKERQNDADAIQALLTELRGSDEALGRQRAIRALAADHGEYAAPAMVRALADPNDDDWRVTVMNALSQMDTDVVPPLIEALATEDAFQRRNVAAVLGYIGDGRAAGVLTALAQSDSDSSAASAAAEAAQRCGSNGDALGLLLRDGDDYHHRRATVLRPQDYSEVVWNWEDGELVAVPIPRTLYNNELSKRAYYRALAVRPDSLDALAGIARACVEIEAKVAGLAAAGEDVGDLAERAAVGSLAVSGAGVEATDLALQWSVLTDDATTGIQLCRALATLADRPTDGLVAALGSEDGGMSGEAAVALGNIAWANGLDANPAVVRALGNTVGREIVRIAALIDGNPDRANAVRAALAAQGVLVNHRGTGASGLSMLHRIPGLDVVLVGDGLPDMTLDQVLGGAAQAPASAEAAVFLITESEDLAGLYADRVAGAIAGVDGLAALDEVFSQAVGGDRARADELARRAAGALARLAQSGRSDVRPALDGLSSTLQHRDDSVAIPAMAALAAAGDPNQIGSLVAVVTNADRSEEARVGAAAALVGIFGRHPVGPENAAGLRDVATGDDELGVRLAAARALGRLNLSADERASLLREVGFRITN